MSSLHPTNRPGRRPRAAVATAAHWTALQGRRLGDGVRHAPERIRRSAQETWADRRRRARLIRTTVIWTIIAVALVVFFSVFSWDWFRGPIARYASARTGRDVRIEGHLVVHPFSWTPSATVGGLKIGHPKWMNRKGDTLDLGRATVKVRLKPLLTGHLELPLVDIEHPKADFYADRTGRNNWTLGGKPTGKPAKLPLIQQFILNDGQIRYVDEKHRITFNGTVTTTEGGGQGVFRMEGQGALNRAPFTARVSGAPLLNLKRDQPYPFKADLHAGLTHVTADGQVVRPFDFGRIRGAMSVTGPDMADLYYLTGVVFPNSPPYRLSGQLTRDGERYQFRRFSGRMGGSDLHGNLLVETRHGRKFLRGDLGSTVLDFNDMGALFGARTRVGTGMQAVAVKAPAGPHRLLPDAPLYAERVRSMDADVRYHAASVKAPNLPLKAVDLHLTLDHGLLKLDPVSFTFPRGQARGTVRLDARPNTPITDVDFTVNNLRVEDFLPRPQGMPVMEAPLEARAKLHGLGNTMHKAAASSNGRVAVAMTGGQMRKAFAELMGVNIIPGLPEYLSKNPKQSTMRCAVAVFDVNNGVLRANRIVMDTGPVVLAGGGTVNLGTETIDLTLQGKSKKPRILRAIVPFHVQGTLAAPKFKVDAKPVIAQAGIGAALGAVLSPLAAILPFISPGGAKDANCAALLAEAQASGAPVRAVQAAAPAKH